MDVRVCTVLHVGRCIQADGSVRRTVTNTGAFVFGSSPGPLFASALFAAPPRPGRGRRPCGLSTALNLELIDLSPAFESAAKDGRFLYYPFDTHWNSEGREVAAAFVVETLRTRYEKVSQLEPAQPLKLIFAALRPHWGRRWLTIGCRI